MPFKYKYFLKTLKQKQYKSIYILIHSNSKALKFERIS